MMQPQLLIMQTTAMKSLVSTQDLNASGLDEVNQMQLQLTNCALLTTFKKAAT